MNELRYLSDFEKVLRNYRVSENSKALIAQVNLVLLVAPSSSGRNTIIRELLKTGHYHYIISDTTRQPRTNDGVLEQNGVEYWFRPEADVLDDLKNGRFLEAAIIHKQQVSGISLRELEVAKNKQQIAITDIEIAGVHNIIQAKPDALAVFIVPPKFEEWQRRMLQRGHMEPKEYKRRLESALVEFRHALEQPYYHFVINNDFHQAVAEIEALTKHGGATSDYETGRQQVEQLYKDTEAHLRNL